MSKCNIGKFIATSLLGSSLALNGTMPGIVALADLGERRGEKGILEPRVSLLQFLHDGHRLVNRHHR